MHFTGVVAIVSDVKRRDIGNGKGVELSAQCRWRLPRATRIRNRDGEWAETWSSTSILNFVFWKNRDGKLPWVVDEVKKGNTVFVSGYVFTTRSKDGNFVTELRVERVDALPRASAASSEGNTTQTTRQRQTSTREAPKPAPAVVDDLPF